MTFKSWRIHYADGSAARGSDLAGWALTKADEVQVVTIFFEETYGIYKQDGYDGNGFPINQRLETENYCQILTGHDYYYFVDGKINGSVDSAVLTAELSLLPAGAVKTGSLTTDQKFYDAYNDAEKSRAA